MNNVIAYLIVYFALIGGTILIGFLLHLNKSKADGVHPRIRIDEITVLIPFRNEGERIGDLLKSILNSKVRPNRFIFIDDHSSDDSVRLIEQELNGLPYEILSLPEKISGKKKALRAGISASKTKYILTLDADVSFKPSYFDSMEKLEEADMYVLPAVLIARKTQELFYELDVALANALNVGLSGWSRPIFSSGANFLFNREAFNNVDDLASHAHMASGDDTYLLRDFRKHGKDIRVESGLNVSIRTETPHSFREFIDQRLRWVGKTADIGDSLATLSATGQFVLAIGFFCLLIYLLAVGSWVPATVLFCSKIGLDLAFFYPYFNRIKRMKTWCLIPIYEVVFPLYSLLLGILMISYQPKWKGRSIQSNNS